MSIDHDFIQDIIRKPTKPGMTVWTCTRCDTTIQMPYYLTQRAVNAAMANKFPCIPYDHDSHRAEKDIHINSSERIKR